MNLALLRKNLRENHEFIIKWLVCFLWLPCASQTYQVLHHFSGDTVGPEGSLALVSNTIYGTTRSAWGTNHGTVYKINTDGSGFAILKTFSNADGSDPLVGVVCSGTTLYGATYAGGTFGEGTIFRLETDGSGFRVLKSFDSFAGEGAHPGGTEAPLLIGNTLYGTTQGTGIDSNHVASGWGTVYRIQTDGTGYTMLKNFPGGDESYPAGSVVLQGQTLFGTTSGWATYNRGTVFKVNTDGTGYSILWRFTGGNDASFPLSGLILSGNTLFGSTYYGPNESGHYSSGTVFRMNTDGSGMTLLKAFGGPGADAFFPRGGLLLFEGVLYGTTLYGGSIPKPPEPPTLLEPGTIFAITTNGGAFSFLKRFTGPEGGYPNGSMVLGDRVIYGVASGGDFNRGVLYSLAVATPAISWGPPTQTVEVGADVDLSVQADGVAPFTYQWWFNVTNLMNSGTSGTFWLRNIQPSQSGVYQITVSNAFGGLISSPIFVNVIPTVPRRTVAGLYLTAPDVSELHLERIATLYATGSWTTCDILDLGDESQWYFDTAIPLQSQQFYRAWHTNSAQPQPILNLHLVPEITLTGAIEDSLRLERIDQFGPIDAWVDVATVTLTNVSQVYFDLSSIDQLKRLYRIVRLP